MPEGNGDRPLRLARGIEHLVHWWREPVAGVASLAIGCYDTWVYGRSNGLTSSLDEVLIISGIVLIAGSRRLFGSAVAVEKNDTGEP